MSRVHISFPVKDLDRSIGFYSRLFGADPSKLREDYANFRLDEPPIHLSVIAQEHAPKGPASQHFGVELPDLDTLASWRERTGLNDLDAEEEPDAKCCYARAEKLWLTDPDGHRWEIWVRTGEYDRLIEPTAACCA